MKIAFVYTPTKLFWSYVYRKYPWLHRAEYNVQLGTLLDEPYMMESAWQPVLATRGYECMTCLTGIEPLDRAWVLEHGRPKTRKPMAWQVVMAQLTRFKPDIVYCIVSNDYGPGFFDSLRLSSDSIRSIIGYAGSFTFDTKQSSRLDAVICCSRNLQEMLQVNGLTAYYIPHAFDTNVNHLLGDLSAPIVNKVVFSGNLVRRQGMHMERERLLRVVAASIPMAIYTQAGQQSRLTELLDWLIRGVASGCSKGLMGVPILNNYASQSLSIRRLGRMVLPSSPWLPVELSKVLRPPVYGLDSYRIYKAYAVTLNHSGEFSTAENLRLFEATGVGACLLTDWKENLTSYFEPDHEIVTYSNPDECIEKAGWLIENPKIAMNIGVAAAKRCASSHTYDHRADQMDSILQKCVNSVGSN